MTEYAFAVWVPGRPAPQGSKESGSAGQLRESSVYLPAWRAAVRRAVYEEYRALGIKPEDLPLFRGPVQITRCTFTLDTGDRIDSPPDIDKLLRAVFDALTLARLWEDDGRVVYVGDLGKVQAEDGQLTGVEMVIRGRRA